MVASPGQPHLLLGGTKVQHLQKTICVSTSVRLNVNWHLNLPMQREVLNRLAMFRNLTGNKVTILDPRYTPTGGLKLYPTIRTDWLDENGFVPQLSDDVLPYEDDAVREPSKFFMIYETGDNTTVTEGEATPLNLYYSRATVYGDESGNWIPIGMMLNHTGSKCEDYRWNWRREQS